MTQISDEAIEAMVALVRKLSRGFFLHRVNEGDVFRGDYEAVCEAHHIVAMLPKPVDPDLIEAREIGAACGRESGDIQIIMNPDCWRLGQNDSTHKMKLILAAIKATRAKMEAE